MRFTRRRAVSAEVGALSASCLESRADPLPLVGALTPSHANNAAVRSEVLFATTSGALRSIADIGENESKILSDLQRNMDEVVTGPGVSWRAWV